MAFRLDMDVDGTDNRLVEDRIMPRRISVDGPRRSLWQIESHPVAVEGPVTTPLGAAQFPRRERSQKECAGLSDRLPA
jgi:primary-amine oxidase